MDGRKKLTGNAEPWFSLIQNVAEVNRDTHPMGDSY